ncbi:MAG: TlpA family protein disulfide reductase [Aestuariivirgaceae bacterium]|nr:TlpA family protein disulfide reductase [Aestuariivirgaceae bacterium]
MKIWLWRLVPTLFAALVLMGIYLTLQPSGNAPPATPVARGLAAFVMHPQPKPLGPVSFTDGEGKPLTLADFKGRTVLLNLWATWCAPCRKEMPDLARLQEMLGGGTFEVVAVSVDRKGAEASDAFLKETGATALKLYLEPTSAILNDLKSIGLPTTILINADGMEMGRLIGPADWASPQAVELIRAAL